MAIKHCVPEDYHWGHFFIYSSLHQVSNFIWNRIWSIFRKKWIWVEVWPWSRASPTSHWCPSHSKFWRRSSESQTHPCKRLDLPKQWSFTILARFRIRRYKNMKILKFRIFSKLIFSWFEMPGLITFTSHKLGKFNWEFEYIWTWVRFSIKNASIRQRCWNEIRLRNCCREKV